MLKRSVYAILAAVLLMSCVFLTASCAGNTDKIKITVGMWPASAVSLPSETAFFRQRKAEFEKDYPEYEIVESPYTFSRTSITAKIVSGQLPVLFQLGSSDIEYVRNNSYIADLTNQLEQYGWLEQMDDSIRKLVTVGGAVCGVPKEGYGMGLFLNLAKLFEAGVIEKSDGKYILFDDGKPLYPTTFSELHQASQAIKAAFGSQTYALAVMAADSYGGMQFNNIAWNFGCEALTVCGEDGTWSSALNSGPAVEAMDWIRNMRRENLLYYSSTYLSYNDLYKKIGMGEVAMAFCNSDSLAQPVINYGFDLSDIAFVPLPSQTNSSYTMSGCSAYAVSAKATEAQTRGALLFLKYLGESPDTGELSAAARRGYYEMLESEGSPVLPLKNVWKNNDYLSSINMLYSEYCNIEEDYYSGFFENYGSMKRGEEPHYRFAMYSLIDSVLQNVLAYPQTINVYSALSEIKQAFEYNYLSRLNYS